MLNSVDTIQHQPSGYFTGALFHEFDFLLFKMIATLLRLNGSVELAGDQKSMDPMAADGKSKFSVPAGTPFWGFWGIEMIYKVVAPTLQPVLGFDLACQDKRSVEKFLDATITV